MFLVVALILPLALACPEIESPNCYDSAVAGMMQCWGGFDVDGCALPDFCAPAMSGIIGDDGTECPGTCPVICNENQIHCDGGIACFNGCPGWDYCAEGYAGCPAMCSVTCNYDAGEQYCDMGMDDNQCWMGAYCAEPSNVCPAMCPTVCGANETICEHPNDANGCSTGGFCAPAGTECPVQCPTNDPVECDAETEMVCWGGNDAAGCALPDYCTPMMVEGANGTMCYGTCYQSCGENELNCYNGVDDNGCDMGNYCASGYDVCPPVCHTMCLATETYCDMGLTEDNCWLGNYCLPEGEDCAAPAMPAAR